MKKLWPFVYMMLLPLVLLAQNNKPRIEKEPYWITAKSIDYSDTKLDKQAEDGFVDMAFVKQVSVQQQSTYYKRAIRIISESGVQNSSEVNIAFDPSYNQLVFHSIRIIRGSATMDKLQLSKIKIIQQETELNRHLYDGSLSAVLFLEDVRKGDIIEYSYTIKGFNPVFKGKVSESFDASFSVPMYNLYYKLVIPKERNVQIKNYLTDVACTTSWQGSETVYEWKFSNIPAIHTQDRIPAWFDPYAMIMVSEYQNWKEVNDWALGLFSFNIKPSLSLQKKIDEIRIANETPDKRVLAALRFVQDDIRYLGIEMGQNSHKPNSPDKVFAQRFGDCKDKSYLLCTMLRALDINAWPVLINTTYKRTISSWLPSAVSFDHTTVRVLINGQYYWFDPTIRFQRGNINAINYPDYQCGLVISDTTTALTFIPSQHKSMADIKEEFTVHDFSGKAILKVQTTFTGSQADDTRDEFNSKSVYELQKTYKEFYGNYFEKITADSLAYTDDENTGKFTTTEYYTIQNFWETEKGFKKSYFSPYVINSILKKPKDEDRKMPFYINYPAKYREEIIVNLPEEWSVSESMEEYKCSAFKLRIKSTYDPRKYKLRYDYESLKDHVMPDETEEYLRSYNNVDDNSQYYVSVKDPGVLKPEKTDAVKPQSIIKGIIGILAFIVLLAIALVTYLAKLRR